LAEVAESLRIERLAPEWIGGNIALSGVPSLSLLPPRTLMIFSRGAAIRIDGDNGPCRKSGKAIADRVPGRPDLEFGFVQAALGKRGLVGWVEREGAVRVGDSVKIRIWQQALYPA
jgi:MOSC domain-containing protein YiiM